MGVATGFGGGDDLTYLAFPSAGLASEREAHLNASRKGHVLRWFHGPAGSAWHASRADFSPEAVERTLELLDPVFEPGAWLPTEVQGWEHIPPSPVLFVSNHSGGTLIPDVWGFLYSWYRHFGTRRPLHPLAHDMLFATRSIGRFFSERGVVRAHKEDGLQVLRDWKRDLIVYPGGDRDTWRPFSHRFQVSFAGRKGYARLALEAGVPIVPVAHAGAHETLIVLRSGRRIAKALKLPQLFRAEIMPVHISIPWGLTVGPWPHIPLPTRFRYRIGPPVALPSHDGVISQALVDEVDARVRSALQAELTELEFASEKRQETPRPRRVVRREPRVAEPSDRPVAPPPAV